MTTQTPMVIRHIAPMRVMTFCRLASCTSTGSKAGQSGAGGQDASSRRGSNRKQDRVASLGRLRARSR